MYKGLSFHLFASLPISFVSVLYFSLYRAFTSLVNLFLGILLFLMLLLTRLSYFFLSNISKCQEIVVFILLLDF